MREPGRVSAAASCGFSGLISVFVGPRRPSQLAAHRLGQGFPLWGPASDAVRLRLGGPQPDSRLGAAAGPVFLPEALHAAGNPSAPWLGLLHALRRLLVSLRPPGSFCPRRLLSFNFTRPPFLLPFDPLSRVYE